MVNAVGERVTNQWVYTVTHKGHRGAILNAGKIFPLAILAKIERFLSLLALSAETRMRQSTFEMTVILPEHFGR